MNQGGIHGLLVPVGPKDCRNQIREEAHWKTWGGACREGGLKLRFQRALVTAGDETWGLGETVGVSG